MVSIDPLGAAIGIVGLLASFKGAVDGFLLIESVFDKDGGLKDLLSRLHVIHVGLNEWLNRFNVRDPDHEKRLLHYATDGDKKLIFEILDRIEKHLADAQNLLVYHTRAVQKRPFKSLCLRVFNWLVVKSSGVQTVEDERKNRIRWAIRNKTKFTEIITMLEKHYENLLRRSKDIALLELPNWTCAVIDKKLLTENEQRVHESHHVEARQQRHEGTGRWLFHRTEFVMWLSGEAKDMLWIHAIPEAGKTILASTIIDQLCDDIKMRDANIGLAYFYCKYTYPERQKLSEILGSLIAQLSLQNLAFRFAVSQYLASLQQTHEAARSVKPDDLKEILIKNHTKFDEVFLVLDAIDECVHQGDATNQKLLLNCLVDIQKKVKGRIKILVTSRPIVDIPKAFPSAPVIIVLNDSNSSDIELYVKMGLDKAIQEDPDWLGDKEDRGSMKLLIVSRLVEKANGMFLFAKLLLDILRNCRSGRSEVLAALADLPRSLDETWVRLLEVVDSANPNKRNHERIKKILKLLVASARPLKVDEIKEAIAVEEGQTRRQLNAEIEDSHALISICGPLVRTNAETGELYLAHFSLREFLISGKLLKFRETAAREYNIDPSHADAYLATVSLTYLSFQELSQPCKTMSELENLREHYKFLDYATLYGGVHLGRLKDASHNLIGILDRLFVREIPRQELPNSPHEADMPLLKITISVTCPAVENEYSYTGRDVFVSMAQSYPEDHVESIKRKTLEHTMDRPNCKAWLQLFRILSEVTRRDHPANITPLYYASLFGWNAGVARILQLNNDRATTSDLNHALRAAAIGNNCDIVKMLVGAGAQVEAHSTGLGSALQSAALCGQLEAVETLLRLGATAEEQGVFYRPGGTVGSALQGTAIRGDTKLVQILLDHGENVNSNRGWLDTPLQTVMERRMEDMAIFLMNCSRFDDSVSVGYNGSALPLTCLSGDGTTHALLTAMLDKGATRRIRNAVHNKIWFLLENEPTHQNGHLGRPLQAAAFRGHSTVLKILLEHGAEVNTKSGFFGTALQAAASRGHTEAVKLLLENGADPNLGPAGHFGCPLSSAIALNLSEVVRELLNHGADPLVRDEHGWDARVWNTLYRRDMADMLNDMQPVTNCSLPTAWSLTKKTPKLGFHESGRGVKYHGKLPNSPPHGGAPFELDAAVIADHPIPPYQDYYFEVEIANEGNIQVICIGLSEKDVPLFKLPGHAASCWGYRGDDIGCFAKTPEPGRQWPAGASWGYHGDDGRCFAENRKLDHHWPKFTAGDVVGCGVEWGKDCMFFTLNGTRLEPDVLFPRRRLYPALGMIAENASVQANFGEQPFRYSLSSRSASRGC